MVFEIPMAESWSKKKKELHVGKPHTQRPDNDNIIKGIQDILKIEDSSIHTVFAAKFWAYEGRIRIYNIHSTKDSSLESLIKHIEADELSAANSWFWSVQLFSVMYDI